MKTVIEMAREVYGEHTFWTEPQLERLDLFAELVRADEREQIAQMIQDGTAIGGVCSERAWWMLDVWIHAKISSRPHPSKKQNMSTEFNKWWNEDLLTEDNPFVDGTPAYWAWEGWCAGVKAEREACAQVCETLELLEWPDKVRQPLAQAIRARGTHEAR